MESISEAEAETEGRQKSSDVAKAIELLGSKCSA